MSMSIHCPNGTIWDPKVRECISIIVGESKKPGKKPIGKVGTKKPPPSRIKKIYGFK